MNGSGTLDLFFRHVLPSMSGVNLGSENYMGNNRTLGEIFYKVHTNILSRHNTTQFSMGCENRVHHCDSLSSMAKPSAERKQTSRTPKS